MPFNVRLDVSVRSSHLVGGTYEPVKTAERLFSVDSLEAAKDLAQKWVTRNRRHNGKLLLHLRYKVEIFQAGASVWLHDEASDGTIAEIGEYDPKCCGGACCNDPDPSP